MISDILNMAAGKIHILGFFIAVLGAILVVISIFINSSEKDISMEFAGQKFNGPKSIIVLLVGVIMTTIPERSLKENHKDIDISSPESYPPSDDKLSESRKIQVNQAQKLAEESNKDQPKQVVSAFGWAYFGTFDGQKWIEKHFDGGSGAKGFPRTNDHLRSVSSINIRSGPIQYISGSWQNNIKIGSLKPADEVSVVEIKEVAAGFYWVKIGLSDR